MNSVFDKIIEKLEEKHEQYINTYGIVGGNPSAFAVNECIDTVREIAEQYNNGWIPCSELLPAYGQTVLASVCAEDAEWKIIIACYKEEDFWLDGKIDAWQPLPTPYAKGE